MSKIKDKLKASMRPEVTNPESDLKPSAPEKVASLQKSTQSEGGSGPIEKKVGSVTSSRNSHKAEKINPFSQNCWVWPD